MQCRDWTLKIMKARGVDRVALEALPSQAPEEFYSDRMEEADLGA